MPSFRFSPLSPSPKKKFSAVNDWWKQMAENKTDFPFPILKAAIKREITKPVT